MNVNGDSSWLMHYQTLNQVNQCRRLIQAEFDQRLRLSDPELYAKLQHFAKQSQSTGLRRLFAELEHQHTPTTAAIPTAKLKPGRRYRGQPSDTTTSHSSDEQTIKPRKVKIYRGQRVTE